jgi:hypothetical protein
MRAKALVVAAIGAAGMATGLTAAGVASAESAALTVAQLEAQGFDVKLSRIGSAPLDQCIVTDIGRAREETRLVRRGNDLIPIVVARRIAVTVDSSR